MFFARAGSNDTTPFLTMNHRPAIRSFNGRNGPQLSREPGQAFTSAESLSGDFVRGILRRFEDICLLQVDDPSQSIQPQVAIRRFHDADDASQRFLVDRVNCVKASAIELLQPEFAANPDRRSPPGDRTNRPDLNTVRRTECPHMIAVEHGEPILGGAKPHATRRVGEHDHHAGGGQVAPAAIFGPRHRL